MIRATVKLWAALAVLSLAAGVARGDAPAGRYSVGPGTVKDEFTGLTWQQAVDARKYNWSDAVSYCRTLMLDGGGWRLPALKELLTLVDSKRSDPAIDIRFFPDTPTDSFWTASPHRGSSDVAWSVNFNTGGSGNFGLVFANPVRCVR